MLLSVYFLGFELRKRKPFILPLTFTIYNVCVAKNTFLSPTSITKSNGCLYWFDGSINIFQVFCNIKCFNLRESCLLIDYTLYNNTLIGGVV